MKFRLFLIFNFLFAAVFIKCAHTPPAEEVHIRSYEDKKNKDGNIVITYKNSSGSVSLTLDPYDEDLYIEMEGENFDSVSKALAPPQSSKNENQHDDEKQKPETYSHQQMDSIINIIKELLSQNQDNNEKREGASSQSPVQDTQVKQDNQDSVKKGTDTLSNISVKDSTIRSAIAEIRVAQEQFYKQEYSQALEHINNSLSMYETAENLALKGSILYMMNEQKEAGTFWKKALAINPDMPGIKNMMRLIEEEELAH